MIVVFLRFLLFCVLLAGLTAAALHITLRWIVPLLSRGSMEENKAYQKWCRILRVNSNAKATTKKGR